METTSEKQLRSCLEDDKREREEWDGMGRRQVQTVMQKIREGSWRGGREGRVEDKRDNADTSFGGEGG